MPIGIDIGGTKIEAQVFDASWSCVAHERVETPATYDEILQIVADLSRLGACDDPLGISAAGLVVPDTGHVYARNLAAHGRPLPRDLKRRLARPLVYVNDCRALALSEAVFGAGKKHDTVLALVLGTGVSAGLVRHRALQTGLTGTVGEIGQLAAPAHVLAEHGLPIFEDDHDMPGCLEAYLSGPGLSKIASHLLGQALTPHDIAVRRFEDTKSVWDVWLAFAAQTVRTVTLTFDPDVIVLGGGLSQIDGLLDELRVACAKAAFGPFGHPPLALAEGGDASGARGAAYLATQEMTQSCG